MGEPVQPENSVIIPSVMLPFFFFFFFLLGGGCRGLVSAPRGLHKT